jgi:MFS family permease
LTTATSGFDFSLIFAPWPLPSAPAKCESARRRGSQVAPPSRRILQTVAGSRRSQLHRRPFENHPLCSRPIERARLRRSLRACTAEGLFAEVVNACAGGAILTGWALHLHASAALTGLVVALPQMAQLVQIPAAWSTARLGHRRAAVALVAASRQVMLPLCALPFLSSQRAAQTLLCAVAAVSAVLAVLGNNAWTTWMGELVPRRIRGRYFGRRTALCTIAGASASAAAGLLLDWARPRGLAGPALAVLQLCACGGGVATTVLMLRQHDPARARDRAAPRLASALAPFRDPTVRGLLRYAVTWNLGVGLSGSFFALHMLNNLRMGFVLVALHGATLAVARVLAAPLWGRLIDRLGARPVLIACAFGVSAVPLIWLFPTPAFLWPLALDAVMAGALWGGHNLAMFVLPLTATPSRGRPSYIAAVAAAGGFTFTVATACGGLLALRLPEHVTLLGRPLWSLQILFLVSALVRFGAAATAFGIREPAAAGLGALFREVVLRRRASAPRPAPAGARDLAA